MLKNKVYDIAVELIDSNPDQPRRVFESGELEELKQSIMEYGVLQPVIVNKASEGRYFLIAGERRLKAAKLAGLKKIPSLIRETSSKDMALLALVENVQRENLSYIEEARAYTKLMNDYNLTQGQIAKCVGKNQSTISNKIRILSLPEDMQEEMLNHSLTERHARALLKIGEDSVRRKVINRIIKNELNVRQSEKLIEDVLCREEQVKMACKRRGYLNYKLYINSIRKVYEEVRQMEEDVNYQEIDENDFVKIIITLPKKSKCFT